MANSVHGYFKVWALWAGPAYAGCGSWILKILKSISNCQSWDNSLPKILILCIVVEGMALMFLEPKVSCRPFNTSFGNQSCLRQFKHYQYLVNALKLFLQIQIDILSNTTKHRIWCWVNFDGGEWQQLWWPAEISEEKALQVHFLMLS